MDIYRDDRLEALAKQIMESDGDWRVGYDPSNYALATLQHQFDDADDTAQARMAHIHRLEQYDLVDSKLRAEFPDSTFLKLWGQVRLIDVAIKTVRRHMNPTTKRKKGFSEGPTHLSIHEYEAVIRDTHKSLLDSVDKTAETWY